MTTSWFRHEILWDVLQIEEIQWNFFTNCQMADVCFTNMCCLSVCTWSVRTLYITRDRISRTNRRDQNRKSGGNIGRDALKRPKPVALWKRWMARLEWGIHRVDMYGISKARLISESWQIAAFLFIDAMLRGLNFCNRILKSTLWM